MSFLIRIVVTAVAVWASTLVDGIDLGGDTVWESIGTLALVALVFGLVNAIVKPVVQLLTGCLYILTLGLFALVVNALMFLLVGWLSDKLGLAFTVDGFWPAFWGAIIVALVTFVLNLALRRSRDEAPRRRQERY